MGDRGPKQVARLNKQKRAAVTGAPPRGKRAIASPEDAGSSSYGKCLRFRFDRVDTESQWCLSNIDKPDLLQLIRFMADMETMKVSEVVPGRAKREDVAEASKNAEAQARARQQFPDDHEAIHRMHVTGAKVLWGLLYGNEFSIIWWDPSHEIWPTRRIYEN